MRSDFKKVLLRSVERAMGLEEGELTVFLRKRRWLLGACIGTFFYMLLACYSLYKISYSTTLLYDYPYTVSREAQEMKARLYGIRFTLPALLVSPGISREQLEEELLQQEEAQNVSLERIKERFRGTSSEIEELKKRLIDIRQARRKMIDDMWGATDFSVVRSYYVSNVLPYFDELEDELDRLSVDADLRGELILKEMDQQRFFSVVAALCMGLLIIWLIFYTNKLEYKRNSEIAYRERLFNLLAASIDEVFFIVKADGTPEYVSSNSSRIIGTPEEKFCKNPKCLYSLLSNDDVEWLHNVFEDKIDAVKERDVILNNGERKFKIRVYPIIQEGILTRRIIVLADQTEVLAYQQNLRDALESARSASLAKTKFFSHMSHEIRTPMNAIIGMTTIALTHLDTRERVEDCLRKIDQVSRHLLGLINDVLDMSKIESGKLSIMQDPFNFKMSLQNIINLIQPQTRERGLDFEVSLFKVDVEELVGDSLRLNQILINILSNALKFTGKGGSVRLEVHQIFKNDTSVRFRFIIRDTGIGMSPEFLKRLYMPFEQAESSTVSKFGGTGLGMAITQNLVTLLGGTIFVKSEEGKGTEFTVELPFSLGDQQPDLGRIGLEPLKILVVDDDQGTCEHAVLLLEKMGHHTQWTLSGEDAINLMRESHNKGEDFDVCLIDWKMRGMDGEETARRIRSELGSDTLIIIISAYDWTPIEEKAKDIGVNGFIAKPFFASSLYDTLVSITHRTSTLKKQITSTERQYNDTKKNSEYNFTGKRILLVEDNEFNREVAREFLEMTGAAVESAENGLEALKMFTSSESGYYNIILMDVQMPVMDGYEATKNIRSSSHPDAASIPVVAMTANAFSEDVAAAIASGMNGHIAKPIDIALLYQLLSSQIK